MGLTVKFIRAAIIIIGVLGAVFFVIYNISFNNLETLVESEGDELAVLVEGDSSDAMESLALESLEKLSYEAADKTDDEMWVNKYELEILGTQVKDVIENPGNYKRKEVNPPDASNAGELALQLLCPDGYDNISDESMELAERLANLEPIMAKYIGEYTYDCYISLTDGVTLAMDKLSDKKFDEDGNVKSYDARIRPWYQGAVETGGFYCGPAIYSYFYGYVSVIYSYPVYVDGELVAVLEGSITTGNMEEKVEGVKIGQEGFSILITKEAQLVVTPMDTGELTMRDGPRFPL